MKVESLSRVRLLATPWTAAYQAPPSMGFSRREYWSGVPLPSPELLINTFLDSLPISEEKAMATHSSTLAWKIPWAEEPGRLQSMGSLRVRHDLATSLSVFTFMHWRRKWQHWQLQCSFLENSRDWDAWWAAVYGVAQSRTQLK